LLRDTAAALALTTERPKPCFRAGQYERNVAPAGLIQVEQISLTTHVQRDFCATGPRAALVCGHYLGVSLNRAVLKRAPCCAAICNYP
jgi:hypothetical protein